MDNHKELLNELATLIEKLKSAGIETWEIIAHVQAASENEE